MSTIASSQSRLDEKLAQFQEEVRLGQKEAIAKAVKKSIYEKPYFFRRKGNEAQVNFNARVNEAFVQAKAEVGNIPTNPNASGAIEGVRSSIKNGCLLLEERHKLILLANRSEQGWGIVEEYTLQPIWPRARKMSGELKKRRRWQSERRPKG